MTNFKDDYECEGVELQHQHSNIRPAELKDAEDIVQLMLELGYPCTVDQMKSRLEHLMADQTHETFVAMIDRNVVGMVGAYVSHIYEKDAPIGRIIALCVMREFRHRGLGKLLITNAEQWVKSQGASSVIVNSGLKRKDAHEFYKDIGYSTKGLSFLKEFRK